MVFFTRNAVMGFISDIYIRALDRVNTFRHPHKTYESKSAIFLRSVLPHAGSRPDARRIYEQLPGDGGTTGWLARRRQEWR